MEYHSLKPYQFERKELDVNLFKQIFKHLKKSRPDLYRIVISIASEGADIHRSTELPPRSQGNPILDKDIIDHVTEKLIEHIKQGHIEGPFTEKELPFKVFVSPIYGDRKPSGKIRLIINLSAPLGNSVNSAISDENSTVRYPSFRDLCQLVRNVGVNGYLWSIDAKDAYYSVPIHRKFYPLFAVKWLNKYLIFKCLTFGLRSAPKIYSAFADAIMLTAIFLSKSLFVIAGIILILHYLDDYFGGAKMLKTAEGQFDCLFNLFAKLGIPTSLDKCVRPCRDIVLLGWRFCTLNKLTVSLTEKKIDKIISLILSIKTQKTLSLKSLEKLIGNIRYAAQITHCGTIFCRELERVFHMRFHIQKRRYNFSVRLTKEMRCDLNVWIKLLDTLKGHPMDIDYILNPPELCQIMVATDAATSIGLGGFDTLGNWFQHRWSDVSLKLPAKAINFQELLAMVVMAATCGKMWAGKQVTFLCDNQTAVTCLAKGKITFEAKYYHAMANLMRLFAHYALKFRFCYKVIYLEGEKNKIADALSRFLTEPLKHAQPEIKKFNTKFSPQPFDAKNTINSLVSKSLLTKFVFDV